MNDEEVWGGENQAHGYATRVVAKEHEKHEHEHGRLGQEVLERHNEKYVAGIVATVLWRGYCSVYDGAQYNRGSLHSRSLVFIFLHLAMALVPVFHFCVHKVKITRRCRRLATPT